MEEVMQIRCELEHIAIIKEVMFGALILVLIQALLIIGLLFKLNRDE
jgi:hypothetical protein